MFKINNISKTAKNAHLKYSFITQYKNMTKNAIIEMFLNNI